MNKPVCLELLREVIVELRVKTNNLNLVADALNQEIIKEKLEITLKEASISTKKGCGKKWFKKGIGLYYICPDVAGLCPECQKSTKEEEKE